MIRHTILWASLLGAMASGAWAQSTYYVSSTATVDSPCSEQAPCVPAAVWSRNIQPGDTVIFKDGVYVGDDYMLNPPSSLNGTASNPILVKAESAGGVRINGESLRIPVNVPGNDYFVIEDIDAHASSGTVFHALSARGIVFRRCIGWDAADLNSAIFITGRNALIEDCAGFGVARGIFAVFDQDNVTFRRVWGRWEGSTHTGPKNTFTSFYFNVGTRIENAILTWDNGSMPTPWHNNDGTKILSGPYNGWESGNPRGTLSQGQITVGEECVDLRAYGILSYLKGSTNGQFNNFPDSRSLIDYSIQMHPCCVKIENVATWIEPGNAEWGDNRGLSLGEGCEVSADKNLSLIDISQVELGQSNIHDDWDLTNVEHAGSSAALGDSIYDGNGAHLCYRYERGSLTSSPLWPWPMQQRILDATTFASAANHTHKMMRCVEASTPQCALVTVNDPHAVADVMADVTAMFGPPPADCLNGSNSSGDTPPPPPDDIWRTDTE